MDNKEDWEELERWNESRLETQKEKFGIEYNKYNNLNTKKQREKIDKVVKGLNITGKTLKIFAILIFTIAIFLVLLTVYINLSNLKERTDVSIVETIENMYNVKIKLTSQDIDEKENGVYKFELVENNEIKFTAIKNFGNLTEDFLNRSHKYYFDKWDSPNKEYFIVEENITDGILNYDTHLIINNYEDIEKNVNIINEFVDFCGTKFYPSWQIYLKKENSRIYPYDHSGMSQEDALQNAKELYKKFVTKYYFIRHINKGG